MIEYLKGIVTMLEPMQAVIECHGVGYACAISLHTFDKLQEGQPCLLYISEAIREDAHLLYGFVTREERTLFGMLTSVSGVGPNTARCILSALSVEELVAVISSGDNRGLKAVKGIGTKTAQRILVDLHDKVEGLGFTAAAAQTPAKLDISALPQANEAVQALVALGYPQPAAKKAVEQLLIADPQLTVQALVKAGLRMM